MRNKTDQWGNFIFEDKQGVGEALIVAPYKHYRDGYHWLVRIQLPLNKLYYFNVVADEEREAAELGVDAYVRYLVEREEIKRLLESKKEEIAQADREYEEELKSA